MTRVTDTEKKVEPRQLDRIEGRKMDVGIE